MTYFLINFCVCILLLFRIRHKYRPCFNDETLIVITDSACKSSVCVYNMRPSKLSNSIRTELSFDFGSSIDKRSATGLGYKRN